MSSFYADYNDNALVITIRNKKNWPLFFFTSVSLIISTIFLLGIFFFVGLLGIVLVLSVTTNGLSVSQALPGGLICLFFVPWLIIILPLAGYALYSVLWNISGKEIIKVTQHCLTIRREIFGLCRPKKFRTRHIRSFRVLSEKTNHVTNYFLFGSFWVYFSIPKGKIALDHSLGTYRFGVNVESDEAAAIISIIRQYFPELERHTIIYEE